jgi:hypothetical protein
MPHGASTAVRSDQIKLGPRPEIFALKFLTGKDVQSSFPGGRVMFTAVDGRKIFLNDEDANELEHALADQQIRSGQEIAVSRIQHGRGGGFAIRVELAETRRSDRRDPAPARHGSATPRTWGDFTANPTTEELLDRSVRIAQHDPAAFRQDRHVQRAMVPAGPEMAAPPASAKGSMGKLLAGSLIASIDAYLLAADYAKAKGVPVSIKLDFNGEDIRSSASVMQIEYYRSGGTRA